MTLLLKIAVALLALGATALLLWACERWAAPEDLGQVTEGWLERHKAGRRQL